MELVYHPGKHWPKNSVSPSGEIIDAIVSLYRTFNSTHKLLWLICSRFLHSQNILFIMQVLLYT